MSTTMLPCVSVIGSPATNRGRDRLLDEEGLPRAALIVAS
jgi:hypothetical protein